MRWYLLLLLVLIIACTPKETQVVIPDAPTDLPINTLAKAIDSVEKLDDTYQGNWRMTHIPDWQSNPDFVEANMAQVQKLADAANASKNSEVYQFLNARLNILQVESLYQKAQGFDPRELANIMFLGNETVINASLDEFHCENAAKVKRATEIYAELLPKAHYVINTFDYIMQNNVDARELIGTKTAGVDRRPAIYKSQLYRVLDTIKVNTLLLEKYCKVPVGNLYKQPAIET